MGNSEKNRKSIEEIMEKLNSIDGTSNGQTAHDYLAIFRQLKKHKELKREQLEQVIESVYNNLTEEWAEVFLKVYENHPENSATQNRLNKLIQEKCASFLSSSEINLPDLNQWAEDVNHNHNPENVADCIIHIQQKFQTEELHNAIIAFSLWILISLKEQFPYKYSQYAMIAIRMIAECSTGNKDAAVNIAIAEFVNKLAEDNYQDYLTELIIFDTDAQELVQKQREQIAYQNSTIENLRENQLAYKEQVRQLEAELEKHISELTVLQEQYNDAVGSKAEAENRLSYEENRYQKQYETLQNSLKADLSERIGLEIEGLMDVISDMDERDQKRILRRIKRIQGIIENLGGTGNG